MSQFVSEADYRERRSPHDRFPAWMALLHANPFKANAGGTERHVLDLMAALGFPRSLVAYPAPGAIIVAESVPAHPGPATFHRFPLPSPPPRVCLDWPGVVESMNEIVECMGVGLVHIHHLFHWPVRVWRCFANRQIPFFFTVHDFYCVCPNNNLFHFSDGGRCLCDLDPEATRACLRSWQESAGDCSAPLDAAAVERHREEFRALLSAASGVICPSEKTRKTVESYYSAAPIRLSVVPHGIDGGGPIVPGPPKADAPLRVGVLGSVCQPTKGAQNYLELVARTRDQPIEWHFFGDLVPFGYQARLEETSPAVMFHGAYGRATVPRLLEQHSIDVVALAPSVEETFSFTLSEVLCAGVPVVSLRTGALEERLIAAGLPDCLVTGLKDQADLLRDFALDRERISGLRRRLREFKSTTSAEMREGIREVYGDACRIPSEASISPPPSMRRPYEAYCAATEHGDADRAVLIGVDYSRGPWWYLLARRLENVVPVAIQRVFHGHFMRRHWFLLGEFRGQDLALRDLERLNRPLGRVVFRTTGPRPRLSLRLGALDPEAIGVLRLRFRCRIPESDRARLFWASSGEESGVERDSIGIALADTFRWQDVLIDMRAWGVWQPQSPAPERACLCLEIPPSVSYFEIESLMLASSPRLP